MSNNMGSLDRLLFFITNATDRQGWLCDGLRAILLICKRAFGNSKPLERWSSHSSFQIGND